jgi:Pyruvate/2-oxoacid:ferredoxin oxidoreductase delta subunit
MMSDKKEFPAGPNYKAQLKFYHCKGSGECINACPEQAIEAGPERLPAVRCTTDGKYEMLPGKAIIIEEKCTGCGDCVPVCPNQAIEMVLREV